MSTQEEAEGESLGASSLKEQRQYLLTYTCVLGRESSITIY